MTIEKNELIKTVNDTLLRTYPYATKRVITAATKANPCQITIAGHGYVTGNKIWIKDVVGMVELNDQSYTVTYVGANTFTIGVNSTDYTIYSSGGTAIIQTSLDNEIKSTLKDLSKKDNFLKVETTIPTIVGRVYYSLPTLFKDELIIDMVGSYPLDYEPREKFRVNLVSASSSTPYVYTWFGKLFYVRPKPNAIEDMAITYASYHPEDCDTILFEDIYREALQERLVSRVAQSLNLYEFAKLHNENYTGETKRLSANLQRLIPTKMMEDAGLQQIKEQAK